MYLALPPDPEEVDQRWSWRQEFLKTRNSYLIIFAYLVVFTGLNIVALTMPFWALPPASSQAMDAAGVQSVQVVTEGNSYNLLNAVTDLRSRDTVVQLNNDTAVQISRTAADSDANPMDSVTDVSRGDAIKDDSLEDTVKDPSLTAKLTHLRLAGRVTDISGHVDSVTDVSRRDTVKGGSLRDDVKNPGLTAKFTKLRPIGKVTDVSDHEHTSTIFYRMDTATGVNLVDTVTDRNSARDENNVGSVIELSHLLATADVNLVAMTRDGAKASTKMELVTILSKTADVFATSVGYSGANDDKSRIFPVGYVAPVVMPDTRGVTPLCPVTSVGTVTSLPLMSSARIVTQTDSAASFGEIWRYSLEYSCLTARVLSLMLLLCGSGVCTYNLWCNRLHLSPVPARHALFGVFAGVVGIYGELVLWLGVKLISPNPTLLPSQLFCSVTSTFCLGVGLAVFRDARSRSRHGEGDSWTFWGGSTNTGTNSGRRTSSGREQRISKKRCGDSSAEGPVSPETGQSSSGGQVDSSVSWCREGEGISTDGGRGTDANGNRLAKPGEKRLVEVRPTITYWRVENERRTGRQRRCPEGRWEKVDPNTAWLQEEEEEEEEEEEDAVGGDVKRIPDGADGRYPSPSLHFLDSEAEERVGSRAPWPTSRRWVSSTPQEEVDRATSDRVPVRGKWRNTSTPWLSAIDRESSTNQADPGRNASRHRESTQDGHRLNNNGPETRCKEGSCRKASVDNHCGDCGDGNDNDGDNVKKHPFKWLTPLPKVVVTEHLQQAVKSARHHSTVAEGGRGGGGTSDNSISAQGGGTDPGDFDHRTRFIDDDLYYHSSDTNRQGNDDDADRNAVHHLDRREPEMKSSGTEQELLLEEEGESSSIAANGCVGDSAAASSSLSSTTRLILSEKALMLTFCDSDEYFILNEDDEEEEEGVDEKMMMPRSLSWP